MHVKPVHGSSYRHGIVGVVAKALGHGESRDTRPGAGLGGADRAGERGEEADVLTLVGAGHHQVGCTLGAGVVQGVLDGIGRCSVDRRAGKPALGRAWRSRGVGRGRVALAALVLLGCRHDQGEIGSCAQRLHQCIDAVGADTVVIAHQDHQRIGAGLGARFGGAECGDCEQREQRRPHRGGRPLDRRSSAACLGGRIHVCSPSSARHRWRAHVAGLCGGLGEC